MKGLLLFIFILTFSGCAAKKMVVNNADFLIVHQIQKRLSLSPTQKAQFKKELKTFLNEQKVIANELIPLIDSLELADSKIDKQYEQITAAYLKVAINFSKLLSHYMAQMDSKQQKSFLENLKKENAILLNLSHAVRMEKISNRFELIFGEVSREQKKMFKDAQVELTERHQLHCKRRFELHYRFDEIYKLNQSTEALEKNFNQAFSDYQYSYPESANNIRFMKKIIPTLSPKQIKIFKKRVSEVKDILRYFIEANY